MNPVAARVMLGVSLGLLASGCAVDVPRLMRTDAGLQVRVMDAIAADSTMAAGMVERLLADEATRRSLVDMVLANGDAARQAMLQISQDHARLDAVLGLAVQDSAMKQHVLTLLKGMQMAGAR